MKILIIGSEGFIGSHCVKYYLRKGWEVYGVDIVDVFKANYNYIKVLPHESQYRELFADIKPHVCLYATGSASVFLSFQSNSTDFHANTVAVFNILNSIRDKHPDCKFVNLSSAAVYGNPLQIPVIEESTPMPISPYGWHKYYSELVCREFVSIYGIHACSLRLFSVYGPGQKKLLFWDIYKLFKSGSKIKLYGTGDETRDYIYVDDLVLAIDKVIEGANFSGEVYNVASGNDIKIRDAANLFLKELNSTVSINFSGETKTGDPKCWRADISKIRNMGFIPMNDFTEGVKKYILWLKENE